MARLLLAVLFASLLAAQPRTTLKGTLTSPGTGAKISCTMTATLGGVTTSVATTGGVEVAPTKYIQKVVGGTYSMQLIPNDVILPPGTYYAVTFDQCNTGETWTDVLVVRTNATPLKISDVHGSVVASPAVTVNPSQLASGGAGINQALVWNGTAYTPKSLTGSYLAAVNAQEYAGGKVTVTSASDEVIGTDTAWTSDMTGWWFSTQPCLSVYRFTYTSPTTGTLDRPYQCASGTMGGVPSPEGTPYGHAYILTQPTLVPAATHGLGTTAITVQCYDGGTVAAQRIVPATVLAYPNFDVEILWRRAKTGVCILGL